MTRNWHPSCDSPEPSDFDGLDDSLSDLARLFRDLPAPEPTPITWQTVLDRIHGEVPKPTATAVKPRPWLHWVLGVSSVAAALWAATMFGRATSPPPFPNQSSAMEVAYVDLERAAEIHIIQMNADEADRIVLGQPILDSIVLPEPADIVLEGVRPTPDELHKPKLERRAGSPMVVLVPSQEEP